jgi:hypothetical protein
MQPYPHPLGLSSKECASLLFTHTYELIVLKSAQVVLLQRVTDLFIFAFYLPWLPSGANVQLLGKARDLENDRGYRAANGYSSGGF